MTIKELVSYIFGAEAAEDDDIVDLYKEVNKEALKELAEEYHAKQSVLLLSKCNRVEVIDQDGRSYVNWNSKNKVSSSIQDDQRTLKIFISRNKD